MQVSVIAVGRLKNGVLEAAAAQYCQRIQPYFRLAVVEVAEEKLPPGLSPAQEQQLVEREGLRLLHHCSTGSFSIALDPGGQEFTSPDLARLVAGLPHQGYSQIAVLVGGPLGLAPKVLTRVNLVLSLSRLTMTHDLARLVWLEQLYRLCRINAGHPYHK